MTARQWYTVLLEDKILFSQATEESPAALLPVKIETLHPNTDWPQVWQILRTKGLCSELVSFQFKMVHRLLPTQDRVARVGLAEDQAGICLHCRLDVEDLTHCFFDCTKNMQVGLALLGCVQQLVPGLSPEAAVRLEFGLSLSEEETLAALYTLTTGLKYIWEARLAKKVVTKYKMRTEIEARVTLLRKSRYQVAGSRVAELLKILN